jgi:predicted DsbA family dithiol-disulfide isomerase
MAIFILKIIKNQPIQKLNLYLYTMKIEIWSDIACPFCYIGKRRLEEALQTFTYTNPIQITYKSFQLAPDIRVEGTPSLHEYLANVKRISLEQAKEMNNYVSNMASEVGLQFNLDAAIVANTFNAHRFLHLCKSLNKQQEAKELLMKAYFCEGANIDRLDTFKTLAKQLNIEENIIELWWKENQFEEDVRRDIYEAQQYQITGVPLFLFNERIAISGAQPLEVFHRALKRASEL